MCFCFKPVFFCLACICLSLRMCDVFKLFGPFHLFFRLCIFVYKFEFAYL